MTSPRALTLACFCPWGEGLETASAFAARAAQLDVSTRTAQATPDLLRMARLDCDWHGENVRCWAHLQHPAFTVREVLSFGPAGLPALLSRRPTADEERWVIFDGQNPEKIAPVLGQVLPLLRRQGWRLAYYAFDEASRTMPCFAVLAPHLSILVHDEAPLDPRAQRLLPATCLRVHRSWVANFVPFSTPFREAVEPKIVFMGSRLGLTPHRQRQLDFLARTYGDRLVTCTDHSVSIAQRGDLARYQVSLCPEGRRFTSPTMSGTHTDRPFWSGCLGLVPVCEDSAPGGRLQALHEANLLIRYRHGDLPDLRRACDAALAWTVEQRRRTYDHFNTHETVGAALATALAAAGPQ